jgi:hypothetical protein
MAGDLKRIIISLTILVFVAVMAGTVTGASAPPVEWQKVLGGSGYETGESIRQTSDGGYILTGATSSNNNGDVGPNNGGYDAWVVKLDSAGSIQWQKALGSTGYETGLSIQQTSDRGYILAGETGLGHGNGDLWVVKLNSTGGIRWQKVLGGSGMEFDPTINQTSDGGYILAGRTTSSNSGDVGPNHGAWDFWVVKLNSTGAIQWQKVLGGSNNEYIGRTIQQTSDGGYILTGFTTSGSNGDVGPNHGSADAWVVKLNSAGSIQWQKVLGGSDVDAGESIRQTSDGGYILAGYTKSGSSGDVGPNHGDYDVWVAKLNSAGTIQWQKVLGGSDKDQGFSIRQTDDSGYILTGFTNSSSSGNVGPNHGWNDVWVLKLNSTGTLQWQKVLGGTDYEQGFSIWQTADGGYILSGYTTSGSNGDVGPNHGGGDVWVVKLRSDASRITITRPDGGENWKQVSAQTITWSYTGSPGSRVKIELLRGTAVNRVINASTPVGSHGSGSYNWTVPYNQITGNDYRIRITSTSDPAITDTSNANFTISAGVPITVRVPNGGQNWKQGLPQTLRWSYTGSPGSRVRIELLRGTTVNRVINASTTIGSGGLGSYVWTVPYNQVLGSDYRIRVNSTSNAAFTDISNANFTISAGAPLTVTVPNGGQDWKRGSTQTITWSYTGVLGSKVRIELLKGLAVNRVINASTAIGSQGSGSYNWTVPSAQALGTDYKVRITSTGNATLTDTGNGNFTISA